MAAKLFAVVAPTLAELKRAIEYAIRLYGPEAGWSGWDDENLYAGSGSSTMKIKSKNDGYTDPNYPIEKLPEAEYSELDKQLSTNND